MCLKHFFSGVSLTCLLALPAIAAEPLQSRGEISVKGGTDRSLLTTEFWAPIAQESDRVLYGDIRLMGDNDENREGNLGLGYRQIHKDAVLGVHGWIDRRRTQNNSTFHQVTLGVERLGHVVDARANVYAPFNGTRTITTPNIGQTSPYLAGSGIFYDTNGTISETPQYGLDGELGYRIPVLQKHADAIRVYGGGYHFFRNDTENVTGFRVRTEAQINRAISIGARYQYDEPRGSQGFLEATLKFPFSAKKLYQTDSLRARLDESPERDVDIVTNAKIDTGLRKEVFNTTSGLQQRIIHVNNSNTQSGDGTKENPYNTLKAAEAILQDNDIIYINHGTGTTAGMDQGIVINKTNILLIGSGSDFVYDSGRFTGDSIYKPDSGTLITAATSAPVITNTDAFVDDGYAGTTTNFSYTGNGVFVTAGNISISGITVSGVTATGIYVLADGVGTKFNNVSITNVTSSGSLNGRGIAVYARGGGLIDNVYVANNTASSNAGTNGSGIQIRSRYDESRINNTILTNNTTQNNVVHGSSAYAGETGHIVNLTIQNTTSSGNSIGILTQSSGGGKLDNVTISNNTTNMNASGIRTTTNQDTVTQSIKITNNIADNNTSHSIYMNIASTNSRLENLEIIGNSVTGGNGNGLRVELVGGTLTNAVLANNTIMNKGSSGIYVTAGAASAISAATISGNTSRNNQYGLYTYASNATAVMNNISVSGNNFLNNTTNGIYLQKSDAAATFNVDLGGGGAGSIGQNRVFGNTGTDLRLNYTGGGSVTARNNWWGNAAGLQPGRVTLSASTTVDSTAFLTTDPRP